MNAAPTQSGLQSLNSSDTKYGDLPGITCFNISNLLGENDEWKPYPEETLQAAQRCTSVELRGSDHVNLMSQARAIMLRKPIATLMMELESFDIAEIVTKQYPLGVMLRPKHNSSDADYIIRHMTAIDEAFENPRLFYPEEKVAMVQAFEVALAGLQLPELMLFSEKFRIDSILRGLSRMSFDEQILRARINDFMREFLTGLLKKAGVSVEECRHVESMTLEVRDIGKRVAQCLEIYNRYGGGRFLSQGILFAGSGSSGITLYDSLTDHFLATIPTFYERFVK